MENTKILIVDDDSIVREMLSDVLQSNDYTVQTAQNGAEALEKYRSIQNIGLIVSDMNMPEMNGLELIKKLRARKIDIPIIILSGSTEITTAIKAIHSGANDYLIKDENIEETIILSVKKILEKKRLEELNRKLMTDLTFKNIELENFNNILKTTIDKLTQIGTALSSEKNYQKLLEMIVLEARNITGADGGTLYTLENNHLHFMILQNKSLNLSVGGTSGNPVMLPPVPMAESNVSAYCAIKKEIINIPDVYESESFDFSGAKKYDSSLNYKSRSMLVLPMIDRDNNVIGVLQLINSMDSKTGEIVKFPEEHVDLAESLASQAAVAITNTRLYKEIEMLFESLVEVMAAALDEKSPVTRGHISKVAALTMVMAEEINKADDGYFKRISFSENEMYELKIAALLHDVGKVTTPEFIIEKKTKLETIFDRVELIESRIKNICHELTIESLKKKYAAVENGEPPEIIGAIEQSLETQSRELEDDIKFLREANNPEEFMDDKKLNRLKEIASKRIKLKDREVPLITDAEFKMLSVRKGSITPEELQIMRNHAAVTIKMLNKVPFTRRLKNVPAYAGGHHERLDGGGYPLQLKAEQIPLQTRIIALIDLFEALTAKDRPYKKPIPLEKALQIMEAAAKDNHIDRTLFEFFVDKRIYEKLPPS
jgi:response regulator RpfG family c-di-GMP phosphodiesterase